MFYVNHNIHHKDARCMVDKLLFYVKQKLLFTEISSVEELSTLKNCKNTNKHISTIDDIKQNTAVSLVNNSCIGFIKKRFLLYVLYIDAKRQKSAISGICHTIALGNPAKSITEALFFPHDIPVV